MVWYQPDNNPVLSVNNKSYTCSNKAAIVQEKDKIRPNVLSVGTEREDLRVAP